jgi:sugar lactone lactonase YvrE
MTRELRTVLTGYSYFECPRWHDGRLFVSDFYTHQVLATTPGGDVETIAEVPGQPAGLGFLPDGRLLVNSMRDRQVLRIDGKEHAVHADLFTLAPWHLNDMVVDAAGRAYVGNFGFDLMAGGQPGPTHLLRVDPDGSVTVAADGLEFPNGTVLTDDGTTLIVAETFGQRLTAYDVGADGALTGRREWASLGSVDVGDDVTQAAKDAAAAGAVTPDGICLDAEGAVWAADAVGGRAVRVREGGEVVDEVRADGLGVFACMLGGDDGRTLFLCAAPSFLESERKDTRDAALLACDVDVAHAGRP